MTKHVIVDGAQKYTRISKSEARKMFTEGKACFYIIAHKMRPGMPFRMGMTIDTAHYLRENAEQHAYGLPEETFDKLVSNFCYYNANSYETGTYPAFYLVTER